MTIGRIIATAIVLPIPSNDLPKKDREPPSSPGNTVNRVIRHDNAIMLPTVKHEGAAIASITPSHVTQTPPKKTTPTPTEELSSPTLVEPPVAIKTSVVVDVVDCLKSEGTHVLLPWKSLKEFLFQNVKVCARPQMRRG
jgi:hypothetical protein